MIATIFDDTEFDYPVSRDVEYSLHHNVVVNNETTFR